MFAPTPASLARRADIPEFMDTTPLSATELGGTLRFLERANRRLGGYRLIFGYLGRWLPRLSLNGPVTILDAGTGGADLPLAVVRWGRQRGLDLRVFGLEGNHEIASWARRRAAGEPRVEIVEQSLEAFAKTGRTFDYVTASLLLHHVAEKDIPQALRALDSLARRGLIVSDLRRCAAGYAGARLLTAAFGNRITRHDGPVSVRRSFTEAELAQAARSAGLGYLDVRRHAFFRLAAAGEKG